MKKALDVSLLLKESQVRAHSIRAWLDENPDAPSYIQQSLRKELMAVLQTICDLVCELYPSLPHPSKSKHSKA